MAENITFDFNQSIPDQGLIGEAVSPLETPTNPPKKGKDTFSSSFDSLNSQSVKDVYFDDQPKSILDKLNRPVGPGSVSYAPESLTDQYMYQEGFDAKHFNPFDTTNYQKFADKETWGSALSKGFDSFGYKFGNTFSDYWKGYGRMADALIHLDWDRMKPDEETMMNQYYQDQLDMKKNFVFEQPQNEDSLFGKRSMSEFIGNAGFALGTFAGLGIEIAADIAITALTAPAGGEGAVSFAATASNFAARQAARAAAKEGFLGGARLFGKDVLQGFGRLGAKSVEELSVLNKIDEAASIANASAAPLRSTVAQTFEAFNYSWLQTLKSKSFAEFGENFIKGTPLLGTGIRYGERVAAAAKGGASAGQLVGLGLQGLRRVGQEMNMAATEASFEGVTSYGDTLDKMVQQYKVDNNGAVPSAEEFEKMRNLSMQASSSNFNTNMAVLLATNKLEFGTLFSKFLPANMLANDVAEQILRVEGKAAASKLYKKGFTGAYGVLGQVAKDFGKKEAAYQFGKAFFKDALKFEIAEGLQENIQETTAAGWRDYYAGQMNGTKYSLSEAFGKGAEEQFTKQGLKTFLMGALTGSIIRLPTAVASRSLDAANRAVINNQYKNDPNSSPILKAEKQLDEDLSQMNSLFKQAHEGKFEQKVFNFNAQMNAAQDVAQAAAQGSRYEFENGKDNSLLSAVASAKRTHSIDMLYKAVKDMGVEMSAEEFEKSFGYKLENTKYATPQEFSESVARDIKKYSETIDNVTSHVKNKLANPMAFSEGTRGKFITSLTRQAQEDAIQVIALNAVKGEMTANRAKQVASEILAMPNMGASADFALRTLTNAGSVDAEIGNILAELKILNTNMQAEGIEPDAKKALAEQIKNKQEELALVNKWKGYWDTRKNVVGKDSEGNDITEDESNLFVGQKYQDTREEIDENGVVTKRNEEVYSIDHPEVLDTFRKLMAIKNKQADNKTEITEQTLRDSFEKIYDYMRLDQDTKDYMRSVDILMNPENFQRALARMADGKFKHKLIAYVDTVSARYSTAALTAAMELGLNQQDYINLLADIGTAVTSSEAYNNILTLAIDPNVGIENAEYAQKLSDQINETIKTAVKEGIAKYKSDGLSDLSVEELDEIIAAGTIDDASVRKLVILDKLVKNQPLLPNEQKVYNLFKEDFDNEVTELKAKQPVTEEPFIAPTQEELPEVGPDGELIANTPVNGGDQREEAPTAFVDENGDLVEEPTPIETETETLTPVEQPVTVEPSTNDSEGIPMGTDGSQDASNMLAGLLGITPVENEEPFVVDGTTETGFDVVDKSNTPVTNEKFDTEEKAQELSDSLNATRLNLEFAKNFISPMLEDLADNSKIVEMHDKAMASMKRFNSRNKTNFETLEEYYKTPKGKELLTAIRESIITGQPVKYGKPKAVVVTTNDENQPTLFDTTTTPATSASLTLESLEILHAQIQQSLQPQTVENQTVSDFANNMFPETAPLIDGKAFGKVDAPLTRGRIIEKNGITYAEYINQNTNSVDIYFAAQNDNEYLGYMRVYENGKPTERFTSKLESKGNNKVAIKEMIVNLQSMMPAYHEYSEDISVSTDGLRWFVNQLKNGYELLRDSNNEIVTDTVSINGAALVNELGVSINDESAQFDNLPLRTQEDFNKAKGVIESYLKQMGVTEPIVRWGSVGNVMTARFNLPVLVKRPGAISAPEMQQVSEKSSKFVEGGIVTEESILDELRKITDCFS